MHNLEYIRHCYGFTKHDLLTGTLTVDAIAVDEKVYGNTKTGFKGLLREP